MKSKWFAFGCLSSVIILVLIVVFVFYSFSRLGKSLKDDGNAKVTAGSYLHLDLSGELVDYNEYTSNFFFSDRVSVFETVHKINRAAEDDNIIGIFLEPRFAQCGFADVSEITLALKNFKDKGKNVIAYLQTSGTKDYLIASVANEIYLNPSASAGLYLTGIGLETMFLKGLLDKLGIEFTVIHAGKSKGAGEPYSRTAFSQPVRENLELLVNDLYAEMISRIASSRNLTDQDTRYIFESRPDLFISQEKAVVYGLVDGLMYKNDIFDTYGIDKNHLISFEKYKTPVFRYSPNQIAIVYAQGIIQSDKTGISETIIRSEDLNAILRDIENNETIKGVVLRVNSPGGSALESEIIAERIEMLNIRKPVVISMGNVAASGGYYISTEASYIIADPGTITGSIGVVGMLPNFKEMSNKIGLNNERISKGKYNYAFSPWEKPDEEIISDFRTGIEKIYAEFKNRVAQGRGLELSTVDLIAEGQVWSAEQALENGLIDEIGGIKLAYEKAAELAGIEDFSLKIYPKQKSLMEEILRDKFDLDVIWSLIMKNNISDFEFDEIYDLYENIRQDPVQTMMLIELK